MIAKSWVFTFTEEQRQRFRDGELWREWFKLYPGIFDEDDLRLVKNQASLGYHFYEWLAAILVYQEIGYLSLVEKYGFGNHNHKQEILRKLVPPAFLSIITNQPAGVQNPDLLVYSTDLSDWFFCEVKGPTDRLRPFQKEYFAELEQVTGKPVNYVKFKQL